LEAAVGATVDQDVTVTNFGTADLHIAGTQDAVVISGTDAADFSQTNGCVGQTIALGDTCTITE
jgi:hypothetical protein